jgi:hypothetical protein
MAVQVAADLLELDEVWRLTTKWLLAQLRWTPGKLERPKDRRLVGPIRQRLKRSDVRAGTRGTHERGPEPLWLRDNELHRNSLDGYPHRSPIVLLDHGHDLRQRREASKHRLGMPRRADHGQLLTRVAPPAHVAGHLAVDGDRNGSDQLSSPAQQESLLRARPGLAGKGARCR